MKIEEYYEQKPIIYVMYSHYNAYIKGTYEGYTVWIRDIVKAPHLEDSRDWGLWQYSNRGHVDGINGYVDLNCFNGSFEQLQSMVK